MHIVIRTTTRRAAIGAAAAATLVGTLAGCAALKAYFPSRDEVFKPVPVTLGEERIAGGDTSYVLAGRGYRVVTRDRDLLPDAKTSLDRAALAFRRFMGVEPPTADVRLLVASRGGRRRDRARPDSARKTAMAGGAAADSTGRVVTMVAWRADDRGARRGMTGGGASVPTAALVRSWLSAMTDSITHTTAPRPVATLADTSRRPALAGIAGRVGGAGSEAALAGDPRIPSWIEQAISSLVAGSPDPELASARLARQKDKLVPLRTLLTERRPIGDRAPAAGQMADGRGRGDGDERGGGYGGGFGGGLEGGRDGRGGARGGGGRAGVGGTLQGGALFDAEALSVADYLADREGPEFVGTVFRTLVGGGTLEDALRGAHSVAHDLDGFEHGWRSWLDAQAGKVEDEYGQ